MKKVDEAVIQSAELVVRELTEIVTNKGSNIPRLCRVGECEECEKEKKCECQCENCKEVRIRHEIALHTCTYAYLHICTILPICTLHKLRAVHYRQK